MKNWRLAHLCLLVSYNRVTYVSSAYENCFELHVICSD